MTTLTMQQWRVVYLVALGFSTAQIAASLGIKRGTARNHLGHIYGRLGLQSRHALICWAFALGWVCADTVAAALETDAAAVRKINRGLVRCRRGHAKKR
jgi:DNA-binding CsgD family transcriptional regulator